MSWGRRHERTRPRSQEPRPRLPGRRQPPGSRRVCMHSGRVARVEKGKPSPSSRIRLRQVTLARLITRSMPRRPRTESTARPRHFAVRAYQELSRKVQIVFRIPISLNPRQKSRRAGRAAPAQKTPCRASARRAMEMLQKSGSARALQRYPHMFRRPAQRIAIARARCAPSLLGSTNRSRR